MPPTAEGFASRLFLGPALRTQPDRRLVALVRGGYETAFEEIVRRYDGPLRGYAAAIVGARCEDVTQDAFSKALLALRRSDAEIELRPWLFRIVRNTALNDLRDSPPSPEALAETIAGGRSPAEEAERREELADLIRRLRSLPEPQRTAIVMRELEGLSHEEIAAALGVSGGAARQAIHRARRALRDGLGMLLPVPILKALLVGAAAGPVETAAGAAGGAAGAGVALKAATATVLVAGAVGAGVAAQDNRHRADGHDERIAQSARAHESSPAPTGAPPDGGGERPAADLGEDRSGASGRDNRGRGREDESRSDAAQGIENHDGRDGHGGSDRGPGGRGGPSPDHADKDAGEHSGRSSEHSSGHGEEDESPEIEEGESTGPGGDQGEAVEDSESNIGPGTSEDEDGEEHASEDSGDSHNEGGFYLQTDPQPKEDDR